MSAHEEPPHLAPTAQVGAGRLSIQDVVRVARDQRKVADLADEVETRVQILWSDPRTPTSYR